ncbi:DMT family transporter [Kiloniella laminariae]|uniref:DMT family transporter n=1 Tax=Kiloniella laminariae TaxID=454162 RepID=UPI00039D9A79|nr:DMT family transporter [Kiloniella laminariae]
MAGNTAPTTEARAMRGIILMVLAMVLVPGMDGIAKYLSANFSVLQISWARYASMTLFLLPFALWKFRSGAFFPGQIRWQILRSLFLLGSTYLFFSAIALIPITDGLALVFIYPLIVTLFSAIFLKEIIGIRRWLAVIAGFFGILVVLRPGFDTIGPGAFYALASGVCHGSYIITTRHLSGHSTALHTLFFTGVIGSILLTLAVPLAWTAPDTSALFWMCMIGLLAASGHFLIIKSCDYAPASVIAPLGYIEIISATLIGYVFFDDFPDFWTWIGMTIIMASGIYISLRESLRKAVPLPAVAQ